MNIFVGNLPPEATEDDVRTVFEAFGQIESVTIIRSEYTGQSRGFGFVEITAESDARLAINALNGMELKGGTLKVHQVSLLL